MAARPDHVYDICCVEPKPVIIPIQEVLHKMIETVDLDHQNDRNNHVNDVPTTDTRVVGHNEHVILVDHIFHFAVSRCALCHPVESIVLPGPTYDLPIWIGEPAPSVFNVVGPLTLIRGPVATFEKAVAISDVLGPVPLIVGTVDPGANTHSVSLLIHYGPLVIPGICLGDGRGAEGIWRQPHA